MCKINNFHNNNISIISRLSYLIRCHTNFKYSNENIANNFLLLTMNHHNVCGFLTSRSKILDYVFSKTQTWTLYGYKLHNLDIWQVAMWWHQTISYCSWLPLHLRKYKRFVQPSLRFIIATKSHNHIIYKFKFDANLIISPYKCPPSNSFLACTCYPTTKWLISSTSSYYHAIIAWWSCHN